MITEIDSDEARAHELDIVRAAISAYQPDGIRVSHHFTAGMCTREIFMPRGSCSLSKFYKYETFGVLLSGALFVEQGDGDEHFLAPQMFRLKPGVSRVLLALQDSVLLMLYPTQLTDIDQIEDVFAAPTEAEYERFAAMQTKPKH